MSFAAGENVGPYRIIEQLGQGGMATVYKAYHAGLDRYVALKVLHSDLNDDPNFAARFQREARLVAKLEHPHIVPVHDFAEHNKYPYLVMKFIEGETLKARLGRGPLAAEEINRVVDSVGSALAYAHQQGILHRDIKPSNVLIAIDGKLYLADFGLARIAQAGESTLSTDAVLGTPQYISPEQATGKKDLDEGTDIYSFGVMLYEMVVGQVPFSADTPFAIIYDHIHSPLPLPRLVNPAVPESVELVLLKALVKERVDRYATVSELVEAFKVAWQAAGVPMQGTAVMLPKGPIPGAEPAVKGAEPPIEKVAAKRTGEAAVVQKPEAKRSPWSVITVIAGTLLLICCLFVIVASLPGIVNQFLAASTETVLPRPTSTATLTATAIPDPRQLLFADDFNTASPGAMALFASDMMTFRHDSGSGYLSSGYVGGVMPAMYYGSQLGDTVVEFDFKAPLPRVNSSYGFIFRAEAAQDGSLDWYYLLGFAPTEGTVIFSCWLYDQWSLEKSFYVPADLLNAGEYNHVVLEARGADFRAFLNGVLVMEMTDSTVENPGIFGLYIIPGEGSSTDSQDFVYFDNLRIYAPNVP